MEGSVLLLLAFRQSACAGNMRAYQTTSCTADKAHTEAVLELFGQPCSAANNILFVLKLGYMLSGELSNSAGCHLATAI